jgi:hypothetical protein
MKLETAAGSSSDLAKPAEGSLPEGFELGSFSLLGRLRKVVCGDLLSEPEGRGWLAWKVRILAESLPGWLRSQIVKLWTSGFGLKCRVPHPWHVLVFVPRVRSHEPQQL